MTAFKSLRSMFGVYALVRELPTDSDCATALLQSRHSVSVGYVDPESSGLTVMNIPGVFCGRQTFWSSSRIARSLWTSWTHRPRLLRHIIIIIIIVECVGDDVVCCGTKSRTATGCKGCQRYHHVFIDIDVSDYEDSDLIGVVFHIYTVVSVVDLCVDLCVDFVYIGYCGFAGVIGCCCCFFLPVRPQT